jgi:hypothetical protein
MLKFKEAAEAYMQTSECSDIERVTLTILLEYGHLGRDHAIPLPRLAQLVWVRLGSPVKPNTLQNKVIGPSRKAEHFLGTNHRGVFIMVDRDDALAMDGFYSTRIAQEMYHRAHLRTLAGLN